MKDGMRDLRERIQHEGCERHAIGADRVVHDLGWVERQERRPGDGVKALEEEHDRDVAVNQALGSSIRIICIHLGQSADYEQA